MKLEMRWTQAINEPSFIWVNSLTVNECLFLIVGASLLTHFMLKRTETYEPVYVLALLIGLPGFLTPLLSHHFTSPIIAGTVTLLTFWGALVISIIIYRLSPWHPLAEYPGPILARITKFYFAILSLQGKQHVYYDRLHKKYGDAVRVGPNELSIRAVDAVVPMIGSQGLPKGPFWDGRVPHDPIKPMIAIRDKTEHARRRRPWNRAFNTAALMGYQPILTKRCTQLVDRLGEQKGGIDIAKWISYFTYDFLIDMAFGGGTEMMRDGDVDGLWHTLESGQKSALFMSHVPWLGSLMFRLPLAAKDLKKFRAYAKDRARARQKRGSKVKDLYYYLIDEEGIYETPPSVAEAVSDGALAIVAGSDTTSSALANLFYFLLCNPTAYKRLQAEIDGLGGEVVDYAKQSHMQYLDAAIKESLRLFPPVLSGVQRYTDVGKALGKYYIPEGTSVFTPFYALHRDARYFSPLPDSFLPERWLSPEQQLALEPALFSGEGSVLESEAFVPFSMGPAKCVGKNLAWMEMRMLVCLIMHRFDMRFEEGYDKVEWEAAVSDYFVMVKGRLPVILTPRN